MEEQKSDKQKIKKEQTEEWTYRKEIRNYTFEWRNVWCHIKLVINDRYSHMHRHGAYPW